MHSEAETFARYLIKRQPSREVIKRYNYLTSILPHAATKDSGIIKFGLSHPWSIGMLDAYLALARPESEFRRRIFVMLAVLESSHEYTKYFLPRKRSPLYVFIIVYFGFKAMVKIPAGLVLTLMASRA